MDKKEKYSKLLRRANELEGNSELSIQQQILEATLKNNALLESLIDPGDPDMIEIDGEDDVSQVNIHNIAEMPTTPGVEFPEIQQVRVTNPVQPKDVQQVVGKVELLNQPKAKDFPKEIGIKEPSWWKQFKADNIIKAIQKLEKALDKLGKVKREKAIGDKPTDPVHVVLVDHERKHRYTVMPSGGGPKSLFLQQGKAEIGSVALLNGNAVIGTVISEIYDGESGPAEIDNATYAQAAIEYEHHKIHSGKSFYACRQMTLNSGASVPFLIISTDSAAWAHGTHKFRSTGEANFILYEYASAGHSGTTVTIQNRDRNSANTSPNQILIFPGTAVWGTSILEEHIGAGQTKGGEARGVSEIILKQNVTYMGVVTSAAASNDITIEFNWYNHTNKE